MENIFLSDIVDEIGFVILYNEDISKENWSPFCGQFPS